MAEKDDLNYMFMGAFKSHSHWCLTEVKGYIKEYSEFE